MRNHTNKRNSSFNISRKALKQDDSIGDMSDELSSILNITGTNTLLDISLDRGSSSIVVGNGDNDLETRFGGANHYRVTHNVGISSQFLSPRGNATSEASDAETPLQRNKLFPTDEKKKKKNNNNNKKKNGYVGSLKL